jgi:LPXTG-motif cell wall-anchored protein
MDNGTISAVLWIVAGGVFGLYLLRRRKRKVTSK